MQSRIKILGHALHPMLVPFPIAFNTATMVCCMVYASKGDPFWFHVAFIANCAAIVTAVVAMLPGLIDWLSIPELTDAKSTGLKHMIANVVSVSFFIASAIVMYPDLNEANPSIRSNIMLTVIGFLVMLYAGFKGWSMVQRHHIGVDITTHEEIPEQDEIQKNASEIFSDTKEHI
ncbi:DUF2231 domain-containing protein [Parafilimonas terrae]|jgi:uncharacterized membrane protein|uniref:Uncharacterized membrane protein n=1 Tax=Parafilimonas terrae TaxID=1465490 RepID=A0A1I5ST02_9BACT|nr:DUF2231 domain-containing protein [Parafilimonas terrae]SFP73761.1 Uncharacterized membrane protein [Parafilimonas terrae]